MKIKLFYVAFISFIYFQPTYAQTEKAVIPPSPISREFEKYITYNVSIYNGVPEISIPLYIIHMKGLEVPISLSYHASGVKFWQASGEVGLGWVLNPGYRITRTIYGQPDEQYPMISTWSDSLYYYPDGLDKDKFLSKYLDKDAGPNFPRPDNILEHLDGEYDLFNYMLPTAGGNFIISDKTNKTIQTIDESRIKFDYDTATAINDPVKGFIKFDVKDEQGNQYYFGQHSASDSNVFETVPNNFFLPTGWALTKMKSALGAELNFKYKYASISGWNASSKSFTITEPERCGDLGLANTPSVSNMQWSNAGYRTFLLNEISSDKELIKITRDGSNLVSQLEIYNKGNELVKSVDFFYSTGANNTNKFLDSIKIKDAVLNTIQTYKLSYYNKDTSMNVFFPDQWGYYKAGGNYIQNSYHQEFGNDRIAESPFSVSTSPTSSYLGDFGGRMVNSDPPMYYSLRRITYPTGGSTTYDYESNRFLDINNNSVSGGGLRIRSITSNDLINATALKRIYKYGEAENGYGVPQTFVDESYFVDENLFFQTDYSGVHQSPRRVVTYSSYMMGDVSATGLVQSFVTYPEVAEYYYSDPYANTNGKTIYKYHVGTQYEVGGLQRHIPGSTSCIPFQYFTPMVVKGYRYWDKPLPLETDYYNSSNTLVKKDSFTFSTDVHYLEGLKVRPFATADSYSEWTALYDIYPFINSFFKYDTYNITYGRNLLTNKTEIVYSGADRIVNSTNYTYKPNSLFLATESTVDSKGDTLKTVYTYPEDYPAISPYNTMLSRNILTPIIETALYKNETIVRSIKTNFKDWGHSIIAPETVQAKVLNHSYENKINYYSYDSTGNLITVAKENDLMKSYIWDYGKNYPIAECVNCDSASVAYTSFEAEGGGNWLGIVTSNIQAMGGVTGSKYYNQTGFSFSKSGLSSSANYTVTYWSKNGSYSIAGTQSTYPKMLATVVKGGDTWTLYEHLVSGQTTITVSGSGAIDELRLYPEKAQMTTYTYTPFVGMTSQSDASGRITFYEYDSFGRLFVVTDQNGKVLKKMEYKYANQ